MRRKLNSRGELKIDGALCDPRPASSTDAEREFETLFLLGYLHIFTYFVYVSLISVCLKGYVLKQVIISSHLQLFDNRSIPNNYEARGINFCNIINSATQNPFDVHARYQ